MMDASIITPISVFESPYIQASLAGLILNCLSPPAFKHIQYIQFSVSTWN